MKKRIQTRAIILGCMGGVGVGVVVPLASVSLTACSHIDETWLNRVQGVVQSQFELLYQLIEHVNVKTGVQVSLRQLRDGADSSYFKQLFIHSLVKEINQGKIFNQTINKQSIAAVSFDVYSGTPDNFQVICNVTFSPNVIVSVNANATYEVIGDNEIQTLPVQIDQPVVIGQNIDLNVGLNGVYELLIPEFQDLYQTVYQDNQAQDQMQESSVMLANQVAIPTDDAPAENPVPKPNPKYYPSLAQLDQASQTPAFIDHFKQKAIAAIKQSQPNLANSDLGPDDILSISFNIMASNDYKYFGVRIDRILFSSRVLVQYPPKGTRSYYQKVVKNPSAAIVNTVIIYDAPLQQPEETPPSSPSVPPVPPTSPQPSDPSQSDSLPPKF